MFNERDILMSHLITGWKSVLTTELHSEIPFSGNWFCIRLTIFPMPLELILSQGSGVWDRIYAKTSFGLQPGLAFRYFSTCLRRHVFILIPSGLSLSQFSTIFNIRKVISFEEIQIRIKIVHNYSGWRGFKAISWLFYYLISWSSICYQLKGGGRLYYQLIKDFSFLKKRTFFGQKRTFFRSKIPPNLK